ncbi:MAG: hypothetical protein ISS36_03660 [Candidatus Aenigmarchaeota archaeon]|nr:hypothetical protein [Candidatus Aenigmarchaeota archaeon]
MKYSLTFRTGIDRFIDIETSLSRISEFGESLGDEDKWMEQSLRSLLMVDDNPDYPDLHRENIVAIRRRNDHVFVKYEIPRMKTAWAMGRVRGAIIPVMVDSDEIEFIGKSCRIGLRRLKEYSYEANGYVQPTNLEYPKWDLIQQAVRNSWEDRVVAKPYDDSIDFLKLGGEKHGLECITIEDFPLNEIERNILDYCEKFGEKRKEIRKRSDVLKKATKGKARYEPYTYLGCLPALLIYCTKRGRRNLEIRKLREESPKIDYFGEKINSLRLEHELVSMIYREKMKAGYVNYFDRSKPEEMLRESDKYIASLDVFIEEHSLAA